MGSGRPRARKCTRRERVFFLRTRLLRSCFKASGYLTEKAFSISTPPKGAWWTFKYSECYSKKKGGVKDIHICL